MAGRMGFTLLDYSREKSSVSFATEDVTAGTIAGLLTDTGTLRSAIEGVTLGVVNKETLTVFDTVLSNEPPTNPLAQVESAWLVVYEDVSEYSDPPANVVPNDGFGKLFTMSIGTADIAAAGRLLPESDKADLTETGMAALVSAIEDVVRSPYGGNVEVREIRHVGRRR